MHCYNIAQFQLLDTCVHHTHMFSIDFHMLLISCSYVILHMIKVTHQCTRITQIILVKVSFVTNINKSLKTQTLLKCTHATINGLDDNLMDNSNMTVLSIEPRKRIIIFHNNYCLTSHLISCRHIT